MNSPISLFSRSLTLFTIEMNEQLKRAEEYWGKKDSNSTVYNYCNSIVNKVKDLENKVTMIQEQQEQIIQLIESNQ